MEYSGRRDPKLVIVAISVVVVIVIAGYAFVTMPKPTFTVYTYDSFLAWGEDSENIDEIVFGPFERRYGVDVKIERLSTDANGIISRLIAESQNPIADVVIGIDNILILQEQAKTVLEPFTPDNLSLIDQEIVEALDPEHYIVPFDYGLVTLIYDTSDINATTHPELSSLTFDDLADMASMLVTENPHLSSPGLSFLLTQIAIYEELLEEDWTNWWEEVKNKIDVQEGWTEAWSKWDTDPSKHLLVSYGTDPAYGALWSDSEPTTAIAPIQYDGTDYAWMQIEGMGIVKNGPNPSLAQAFIEYCLSPAVQSHIALNQWMFPANSDVELDPVFDYAIHPDDITIANDLLTRDQISNNLEAWLYEYDLIMIG